jgi:hypothetical protein
VLRRTATSRATPHAGRIGVRASAPPRGCTPPEAHGLSQADAAPRGASFFPRATRRPSPFAPYARAPSTRWTSNPSRAPPYARRSRLLLYHGGIFAVTPTSPASRSYLRSHALLPRACYCRSRRSTTSPWPPPRKPQPCWPFWPPRA